MVYIPSKYKTVLVIFLFVLSSASVYGLGGERTESEGARNSILFAGGSGTVGDPYQISNVDQLQNMSQNLSAHYELVNDIDASATSGWKGGNGFDPVGDDSNKFKGSLDGQGYEISDLYINHGPGTYGSYIGLFGYTVSATSIDDVGLIHIDLSGFGDVIGGLVGYNKGMINNSYATGNVSGSDDVGGLVGLNGGTVNNSYATGNVSGNNYTGGLVGQNLGTVHNSYATGKVSVVFNYAGGLVGIAGAVGEAINSFWDVNTTGQSSSHGGTGKTTAEMMTKNTFTNAGWNFSKDGAWWMIDGETRPFLRMEWNTNISNSHQLQMMAMNKSADYKLTDNIDLSCIQYPAEMWGTNDTNGKGFVPIARDTSSDDGFGGTNFTGSLDGQGYEITNLCINRSTTHYIGLFGCTGEGASIGDVGLVNVNVSGNSSVGGLVGLNDNGMVSDSYVSGYGEGKLYIGALVGTNLGIVNNSYATGSVNGNEYIGGLVGTNLGIVNNSYATGSVNGNECIGGLAGQNDGRKDGTINNSYATGDVNGSNQVGGLVGNNGGSVNNSFWDLNTTGQSSSAGGTGKTTAEMKSIDTFTNESTTGLQQPWDFVGNPNDDAGNKDIWEIDDNKQINDGYPFLVGVKDINNAPDSPNFPSPENGAISVSTSPVLSVDVSDPDSDNMNVTFYNASSGSMIDTDTAVADGDTASVSWSSLNENTTYSWYAIADDGDLTNQSDTWSFTTNCRPEITNEHPQDGNSSVELSLSNLTVNISDDDADLMNWTIQTVPDEGAASGNLTGNGTITCNLSSLELNTNYTWYVNVTDGYDWTNESYTFSTRKAHTPDPPSNFTSSMLNRSQIELSWLPGTNSTNTYIRYDTTSYPSGLTEGTEIYNKTGTNFTVSGLNESTMYYFSAWSWNSTHNAWSTSYSITNCSTNTVPVLSDASPEQNETGVNLTLSQLSLMILDDENISWSIETSPNIGSDSRGDTSPGIKNCSVSGLSYNTSYTWFVNVTDGHDWINESYTFSTREVPKPERPSVFTSAALNRTAISLSWVKGNHSDKTYIRYREGPTPLDNRSDGIFVCNSTDTSRIIDGLDSDTLYSFKAWSWNDTYKTYSISNSTSNATTKENHAVIYSSETPSNGTNNQSIDFTWSITIEDPDGNLFNWSIECSNGANNSSGSDINGTKSLILSNLSYESQYIVWVNATDGMNLTKRWFTFTTETHEEENLAPVFTDVTPTNGSQNQSIDLTWSVTIEDPDDDTFRWSIECDNGANNSDDLDHNGTKTLSLSELTYSSQYIVWVNATDGMNETRRWFTFSTIFREEDNAAPVLSDPEPTNGSIDQPLELQWSISIEDPDGDMFNWSIECSSGDSNSSELDRNGTKILSLSNLSNNTDHTIWVNVSDGVNQTKKWYTFTTIPIDDVNSPPVFTNPGPTNLSTDQPLAMDWSVNIEDPDGDLLNWSIEGSNGAGNSSDNDVNGTKTLALSSLEPSTQYTVWVNATDGKNETRGWFTFTTKDDKKPIIALVNPKEGENYTIGGLVNVNWTVTDDFELPSNSIDLYVSHDNGTSWSILAADVNNNGSYQWIPNNISEEVVVKITCTDSREQITSKTSGTFRVKSAVQPGIEYVTPEPKSTISLDNSTIEICCTTPIDNQTIDAALYSDNEKVSITISKEDNCTIQMIPEDRLDAGSKYWVFIELNDTYGNQISHDWNFETSGSTAGDSDEKTTLMDDLMNYWWMILLLICIIIAIVIVATKSKKEKEVDTLKGEVFTEEETEGSEIEEEKELPPPPTSRNRCIICMGELSDEKFVECKRCGYRYHENCISILGACPMCGGDETKDIDIKDDL